VKCDYSSSEERIGILAFVRMDNMVHASLTYLDSFSRFCNNIVRLAFISQQIVDLRVHNYHHIIMLFAYPYNEQIRINELLDAKIYRSKNIQSSTMAMKLATFNV
jgi:hypothetical protein